MTGFKVKDKIVLPHFSEISTFLILYFILDMELYPQLALHIHPVVGGSWLLPLQTESYHEGKCNFSIMSMKFLRVILI